jgi:hypothetical protein
MSRLLKAGLQVCRRHAAAEATRRAARFERLVETAKVLVAGQVHDRPGGAPAFSLLYDMNVVFERFVGRIAATTASARPTCTRCPRTGGNTGVRSWRFYPRAEGLEPHLATFRHNPGDEGSPRIEVWTVEEWEVEATHFEVPALEVLEFLAGGFGQQPA